MIPLIDLLIYLVIIGLIVSVLWWAWRKIAPHVPEPFRTVIMVIGVLLVALLLINALLSLSGVAPIFRWR